MHAFARSDARSTGNSADVGVPMSGRKRLRRILRRIGRSLYLIVLQTAVGLASLLLLLYLTLNSPSAAGLVSGILSAALPGTFEITALQWGPSPGRVKLRGVRILEPSGRPVVAAAALDAQLDWLKLVTALVRRKGEIPLWFDRVKIIDPDVRIEADRFGRLLLPMAFADPDKPPSAEPGPQIHLEIIHLRLEGGRYRMALPAIAVRAAGISLRGSVQVNVPSKGPPQVAWQAQNVVATEVDVAPTPIANLPPIPTGAVQVPVAHGDLTEVQVRAATIQLPAMGHWYDATLPDTVVSDVDLAIALTPEVVVEAREMDLATSTRSAFLGKLLGDKFDCAAVVQGRFRVDPHVGFSAFAHTVGWGKIAGFQTEHVAADVEVHASLPGQAMVTVDGRELSIQAYGGAIRSPHVRYRMLTSQPPACQGQANDACDPPEYPGEPTHAVDGRITLSNLQPGPVLQSEAIAMQGTIVEQLHGQLNGEVDAGVRVRLDKDSDCDLPMVLDVALDSRLTIDNPLPAEPTAVSERETRAEQAEEEIAAVHLRGRFGYATDEECDQRISLNHVLLYDRGGPNATMAEIEHKDGDWLRADGYIHLGDDDSALRVSAAIASLRRLLAPFGIEAISGAVSIFDTDVNGGTINPGLRGKVAGRNLAYHGTINHKPMDVSFARLSSGVRLEKGVLYLDHLDAEGDVLGAVSGDFSLDLFGGNRTSALRQQRLQIAHLAVKDLALAPLMALFGSNASALGGAVSLLDGSVSVDLLRPLTTLTMAVEASIKDFTVVGESFARIKAHVKSHEGHLHVAPLDIQLVTQEWATASIDTDLQFSRFDIQLSLPQTPFKQLSHLMADLPMGGGVGGTLRLHGTPAKFALESVLQVAGLKWGTVQLQDAELHIDKPLLGPAVLSSPQFFPGFRLLDGSEMRFDGLKPVELDIHVDLPDMVDVFAIAGVAAPAGMQAHVAADALAHVDLRPGAQLYTVHATIPPRGLALDLGGGTQSLTNTSPAAITVTPGRVALEAVYFDLGREPLEMCGVLTLPQGKGEPSLKAYLAGTIDVPRIGGLNDSMAAMDLQLDILPWKHQLEDESATCLESAQSGRGYLRLDGALDGLAMEGRLRTRAGQVTPRHFGHDVLIEEGGEFVIQPGRDSDGHNVPGRMVVTIPSNPDLRLSGTIDDGQFDAFGTVTLDRLLPHEVDFSLNGSSIPFAVPKEYSLSLSPQLRFVGTQLDDAKRREMTLSGRVDLPDGAYYRNFDRISGVVGGVTDRQVDQFNKPITETMPWINDIQLDLRLNAQNIEVTSRIPFAHVDAVVETEGLRVTGTLPHLNIVGRARVAPSSDSKITYAINQLIFDVDHLWLDFQGDATQPYIDADIRASITKSSSTTMTSTSAIGADLNTDNQGFADIVVVSVGYSGVLTADARAEDLRFSDNKGDSPADVQCLILFKRKCADSGTGSGGPGVSSSALLGELGPSLLKPFQKLLGIEDVFDQFTFDFDAAGNVGASGSKKLGNQISLSTRVQTGGNDRLYNVSFNFRATDRISAGGLWRRAQQFSQGAAPPQEVYEFKIKYKQPLE
jgi:hypothetical protein